MNRKVISLLVVLLTLAAFITGCGMIRKSLPVNKPGPATARPTDNAATGTAATPTQLETEQIPQSLPDLDLGYIERLPRYDYDAAKNQPSAGETVTFTAHIANRGDGPSGSFGFLWKIDGLTVDSGTYAGLASGQSDTLRLEWKWEEGKHTVSLTLDPAGSVIEETDQYKIYTTRWGAVQKDFKQAMKEFEKAVETYPQGDKVPAAMLKIGFCQQQLGNKAAARAAFEKLIQRFPNTEEARLAGTKVQENN